jgi:integrase
MKKRYRLIRRGERGSKFYCVDSFTGKRVSLATGNEDEAAQIVLAKNQALRQPALNLQIAKAYLAGSDSGIATRTWQQAMDSLLATKQGENQKRWQTAIKDKSFDSIRARVIVETNAERLLAVMEIGTVSTNVFLRKLHNFCLDMNWLPWPIIPKRQWPAVRYGVKRAITPKEHAAIVERETNPERKAFYQLAWHLGASQSDLAALRGEDIDWENRVIGYARRKTGSVAQVHFGAEVATILQTLPKEGPLFPYLFRVRASDRATEFKQRCLGLGIRGVSLHSYRYAWAERARQCGYPERFAQEALGHNSKAVHRAYAKRASVRIPSLDEFERRAKSSDIVPFPIPHSQDEQAVITSPAMSKQNASSA